ncbi:MAG: DegT/DnrJ/EryC1/StrS family aminotransferase [Ignavibacteria bacterium]|nr:DegT/DnrJ/EryC1/StrS family aminotransferase [Ignavibacteria bacterium]
MNKLALLGGKPIRTKAFPIWPRATDLEKAYLNKVVNSNGWGIFRANTVFQFGNEFAEYHGASYGIPCANATIALQIQLQALGIQKGDEVITTIFTCISTITGILNIGAIPIFVDINENDYCIDTKKIVEKITEHTKAIIAVHLYNSLCELDELVEISKNHRLFLIEDAAQVPGSFYKDKGVGTYGICGSFSFQEAKSMTSGEGGIILTNDRELSELINSYINCGRIREGDIITRRVIGGNYRMTNFQAAILLGQLEVLKERTDKRESNSLYLNKELKKIHGIKINERLEGTTKQGCYYYIFKIQPEILGISKDLFTLALEAEGIQTKKCFPLYIRIHFLI